VELTVDKKETAFALRSLNRMRTPEIESFKRNIAESMFEAGYSRIYWIAPHSSICHYTPLREISEGMDTDILACSRGIPSTKATPIVTNESWANTEEVRACLNCEAATRRFYEEELGIRPKRAKE